MLRVQIVILFILISTSIYSQCGELDSSFNSIDQGYGYGDGANSNIYAIDIQDDGKKIVGGNFTSYHGVEINRIARLNIDGSLDSEFDPGGGANSSVYDVCVQDDGKILLGGEFTTFNGVSCGRIVRLNSDGSIDETFDPGGGACDFVNEIKVQDDGKIIIGGNFISYDGTNSNHIARLNSDGSLDSSFVLGSANNTVISIAIQDDDKIVLGGHLLLIMV